MTINFTKPVIVLVSLFALSCATITKNNAAISASNFYTQSHANRLAAEWEPALGAMIVWPLSIPHKLVIELAKDNQLLVTLVENETSKNEAVKWYQKWGIEPAKTKFIYAPQGIDAWWVRDWGPGAVFSPDKKMKLADGKYIYSTPATSNTCTDTLTFWDQVRDNKVIKTQTDDQVTVFIGKQLNLEVLDLPFINTGGNVLTDGLGTSFSTCILTNENRFYGISDEKFLKLNKALLGIKQYNILSNFEKEGIQHIDCYMKLLDEERILVMEPPKDHELYKIYQDIIQNELSRLKSPYGRPYTILRMQTKRYKNERLAAYVNAIIINKTVYVPLFKIEEDKTALQRWQEVMPGYTIKGFEFDLNEEPLLSKEMKNHYQSNYGWNHGDA
ncbi:MAG: agmatine deiminase family protein, partial [Daejeonella sp.]